MIVEKAGINAIKFKDAEIGKVYKISNSYCMCIQPINNDYGDEFNTVDIETGYLDWIQSEEFVLPIDGKFVING